MPNSYNHCALGSICGFLFRRVAGIDAAAPGFKSIVIRPVLDPRIQKAGADYDSVMGRISTDWVQTSNGRFSLDIVIPANATGRIHLSARRKNRISESGREIARHRGLRVVDPLDHEALIDVGSGTYRFVVVG